MTDEVPTVAVWQDTGPHWALVGSIARYESLNFTPKIRDAGDWEITLPYDALALKIDTDLLFTVDWRGARTTWRLDRYNPSSDGRGGQKLTAGGPGALSMLGWEEAWPDPSLGLGNQPEPPVTVSGTCEDVVKALVQANWVDRRAETLSIPASAHLGAARKAKPRFDNLLEVVLAKAGLDGLGVDVGLVNLTSSTAVLELRVWQPLDLSARVHLSEAVGTIGAWSQVNTAPKASRVVVGGAGSGTSRVFKVVTTPESVAAAAAWGGHRVVFVNGPTSYDDADLQEAGEEALKTGASTTNVSLTAVDASGAQAFTHYNVGDSVTGELASGLSVVEPVSSIGVAVTTGGIAVTPTFGEPTADDPLLSMAQVVRAQARRIRALEQGS